MSDWTQYLPSLLQGLKLTVLITLVAMTLALTGGLVLAIGQLDREKWWFWFPCRALVEIVRGTPLLLQIFYAYYVLPHWGVGLTPLQAGVLALALNFSCYISEVYRAGIEAIPPGQIEAGQSLDLSNTQILRKIVLPQAIRVVIPPLGNYFLVLFKDTALLSTISIVELLFATNLIAANNFLYTEMYTIAAVMYFIISFPSALLLRRLERRMKAGPGSGKRSLLRQLVPSGPS
jgi:polar amino acid transport system permease protein